MAARSPERGGQAHLDSEALRNDDWRYKWRPALHPMLTDNSAPPMQIVSPRRVKFSDHCDRIVPKMCKKQLRIDTTAARRDTIMFHAPRFRDAYDSPLDSDLIVSAPGTKNEYDFVEEICETSQNSGQESSCGDNLHHSGSESNREGYRGTEDNAAEGVRLGRPFAIKIDTFTTSGGLDVDKDCSMGVTTVTDIRNIQGSEKFLPGFVFPQAEIRPVEICKELRATGWRHVNCNIKRRLTELPLLPGHLIPGSLFSQDCRHAKKVIPEEPKDILKDPAVLRVKTENWISDKSQGNLDDAESEKKADNTKPSFDAILAKLNKASGYRLRDRDQATHGHAICTEEKASTLNPKASEFLAPILSSYHAATFGPSNQSKFARIPIASLLDQQETPFVPGMPPSREEFNAIIGTLTSQMIELRAALNAKELRILDEHIGMCQPVLQPGAVPFNDAANRTNFPPALAVDGLHPPMPVPELGSSHPQKLPDSIHPQPPTFQAPMPQFTPQPLELPPSRPASAPWPPCGQNHPLRPVDQGKIIYVHKSLDPYAASVLGPKPVRKPRGPQTGALATQRQQQYEMYLEQMRSINPEYALQCRARQKKRAERQRSSEAS